MTRRGVGVQMFTNMNSEWIASFPVAATIMCGLFQFPDSPVNCYQTYLRLPPSPYSSCCNVKVDVFSQQSEMLECDFGTEQWYEATWLNSSTVKCSGVMVSVR